MLISPGRDENKKCLSCHHLDMFGPHLGSRIMLRIYGPKIACRAKKHILSVGWSTLDKPQGLVLGRAPIGFAVMATPTTLSITALVIPKFVKIRM